MKSGNLNFLEPSGPLQACNGTALLYFTNLSFTNLGERLLAVGAVKKFLFFLLNPKLHYDSDRDVASDTVASGRYVLILSSFRGDVVGVHERPGKAER